jgi:hypothetical protein
MTPELHPSVNRGNLRKLADYLAALPRDYQHFDMSSFLCQPGGLTMPPKEASLLGSCGTVACTAGHGPAAGIPIPEGCTSWWQYCDSVFGATFAGAHYQWCFAAEWKDVDNTPQGAAQRIYWLLEHGVPEDRYLQMNGRAPLCY